MAWSADRAPGRASDKKTGEQKTGEIKAGDVLLSTMQRELKRATTDLGHLDPAPYFVSYSVYDQEGTVVVGGLGSLLNSTEFHRRTGEVTMRVGSAALDNTHQENRYSGMNSGLIPLQDDPDAAARVLWQLTHEEYRQAAQSYLNVKTAAAVRTKEEDTSPDFAEEKPQTHLDYATAGVPPRSEGLGGPGAPVFRLFPEVSGDLFIGGDGAGGEDAGAFCLERRRPAGYSGHDRTIDD